MYGLQNLYKPTERRRGGGIYTRAQYIHMYRPEHIQYSQTIHMEGEVSGIAAIVLWKGEGTIDRPFGCNDNWSTNRPLGPGKEP